MKIKRLVVKNYKNLDAELIHDSDIIALIGNNGSGKSNLLEAISLIFRSLYSQKSKVEFDYQIEYANLSNQNVKIEKKGSQLNCFVNDEPVIDISNYLPKKIIAIYSGEEGRLFDNCFGPFYLDFVKGINKASNQGTDYSELPKMLYLNKFYWHLSLLSLLVSESPDNKNFVKNILRIDSVDKIKIDFLKGNYAEYNNNLALGLVRKIDSKSEYKLDELKKIINEGVYTPDDVYKYLYLAFTPRQTKIIENITIKFNKSLTIDDLSEGEKKLLLIKAALEFAGHEDCLFLLDEPDAHVHINNKEQLINCFEPYKGNRQIIITTHSPTVTQCIEDANVYMLNCGKVEDRNKQEIIQEITGAFWNKQEQNVFLSSSKPIILLVEGKHDKEHINNAFKMLKSEYPGISFDIFNMNSACNIPPMMLGLRTTEIKSEKLFVGIFDSDQTGNVELDKTACKFPDPQNKKRHELGFYAIAYPFHGEHKSSEFTVENFFETSYLLDAYSEAFKAIGNQVEGKSINSINERLKDLTKAILFERSKGFAKEDFKNFRLLFDIIKQIKEHATTNKKAAPLSHSAPPAKKESTSPTIVPLPKTSKQKPLSPARAATKLSYKNFFQDLMDELRTKYKFTNAKIAQPQGYYFFPTGVKGFQYCVSFALKNRVRVELYIDTHNKKRNKEIFKKFHRQKANIQKAFGKRLEWEILETKRASRIAIYKDGNINDDAKTLNDLKKWCIDELLKFQNVFSKRLTQYNSHSALSGDIF